MALEVDVSHETARKMVRRDVHELAPKMRDAVLAAVAECVALGFPVKIYECLRTHELAKVYFALGVSKAANGFRTWHFYGLAVDIIHPTHGWAWWDSPIDDARDWRENVVRIFKKHGMDWGGDWITFRDAPHFQWGKCRASPSMVAQALWHEGGLPRVWEAVGAE